VREREQLGEPRASPPERRNPLPPILRLGKPMKVRRTHPKTLERRLAGSPRNVNPA